MSVHRRLHLTGSSEDRKYCNSESRVKSATQQFFLCTHTHVKAFQTPKSCYFPSSYHPSVWQTVTLRAGLGLDWASRESHRLSLYNCRNSLFTALTLGPCWPEPAAKQHSPLTLWLAAPDISRRRGGNSKIRQTGTHQTHTHSQPYQVQATALHEGDGEMFAAFHYNRKVWVIFSESFLKGICSLEKKKRGC